MRSIILTELSTQVKNKHNSSGIVSNWRNTMKKLLSGLLLLVSISSFASGSIVLQPGSSIDISPGENTTVACRGNENSAIRTATCTTVCRNFNSWTASFLHITIYPSSGKTIETCSGFPNAEKCDAAAARVNTNM